ncbi:hypothetical protein [Shewanella algae]|uniref:hypothetical protein n=1 Tax=Shewanella algae TaxID=38313 RepID=UPI0031F4B20E
MKILIVTHFFPPSSAIASERLLSFAKYWSLAGHDVSVLTTKKPEEYNFSLPNVNVIQSEFMPKFFKGFVSNSKVLVNNSDVAKISWFGRVKLKLFKLINSYGGFSSIRFPDVTSFWPYLVKLDHIGNGYDFVVSSHGPYTSHALAYRIVKKKLASRWVMDYRDLWNDNYMYPGLPFIRVIERFLEAKYINASDLVTTVSYSLAEKLMNSFSTKVNVIENGYEESELKDNNIEIDSGNSKFVLSYFGSVYPVYRDPYLLLKAISLLVEDSFFDETQLEVRFYGAGGEFVKDRISEFGLERFVRHCGNVSRAESCFLQSSADILFLVESSKEKGVMTTKLFEYLYSRNVVLAIGVESESDIGNLLSHFDNCHAVNDLDSLVFLIKKYFSMKNNGLKISRDNLGQIELYNRKSKAIEMLSLMENIDR